MEVRIVEVGPRDGLQNISTLVPTPVKLELIARLRAAGLSIIELTSCVSPKAVPQLADHGKLLGDGSVQALLRRNDLQLPVLVPNSKGLEEARKHGVREVAVFVSATEGFSRANIQCSVDEGLDRAQDIARLCATAGIKVRGYVSCIFADPFDGKTPKAAVLKVVKRLLDIGCYEVSIGDTLGVGVPEDVRRLLVYLFANGIHPARLAGHFHDTYGQALGNVWQAFQQGLRTFDSSVAGLGGCPFAPGAQGNLATEDIVYMFENAGVSTGVDLAALADTGDWICRKLQRPHDSRAGSAIIKKRQATKQQIPDRTQSNSPSTNWTVFKETEGLRILRSGRNHKIVLSRPENGNALTTSMIEQLTTFFEQSAKDTSIRRIVITAQGKFFCTGMDLSKQGPVAQSQSASDDQFKRLVRLFEAIDRAPQVTLAAINGPAFGGGIGLAFACDIRIGVSAAALTLSEVKLGLCPATISKYVIRECGPAFAREAMLSGRAIPLSDLRSLGVVAATCESQAGLEKLIDEYLLRLGLAAPRASSLSKNLIRASPVGSSQSTQDETIRSAFDEMMKPAGEAEYGLKEFRAGRRLVDWDSYDPNPKPKL
ncbi:putative secondary metabolism biosynthetic enzyme [Pestalotiopsis sp. IQ-011]